MFWSLTGLAGLLWLASKESSPILLDLRMPFGLKQQLLAALQLELPGAKLEAIAQQLAGAHYHEAADFFTQRARRQPRSGPEPRVSPEPSSAEVRAGLADEQDPQLLDKLAELSEKLGYATLSAELKRAATERRASGAVRPDAMADFSELLRRIRAVGAAQAEADTRVPETAWQDAFDSEPESDDEQDLLEDEENALDADSPAREQTPVASEGAVAHDFEELQ
jgi:hypothetical protein